MKKINKVFSTGGSAMPDQYSFIDQAILNALADSGASCWDVDGGNSFGGTLWRSLGLETDPFSLDAWFSRIHKDDLDKVRTEYDRVVSDESGRGVAQYRFYGFDGQIHWIESDWTLVPAETADGHHRIVAVDREITPEREREEALRAAKARAERSAYEADVLRRAGAIVASTLDVERMLTLILDQAKAVVPYDTASVQLLRDDCLEIVGGSGWPNIDEVKGLRFSLSTENPNVEVIERKVPLRYDDVATLYPTFGTATHATHIHSWIGVPLLVRDRSIGVLTFDSTHAGYFTPDHLRLAASFAEHVAVALYNAQLFEETEQLAMADSLTSLLTRRAFFMNAHAFLEHAKRYDHSVALIMMDIDYFKRLNDEYGHGAGDRALVQVSEAIRSAVRESDILGRYGGEEFVALLPETTVEEARRIAERIREGVASIELDFSPDGLTMSLGVSAMSPGEDLTLSALIELSDKACYLSKAAGRNRVEIASWNESV